MNVIRTSGLRKTYRTGFWMRAVEAVKGVDLEVKSGEIFGFIGPNGAGKTTTMKMLTGLMLPTAGGAWVHELPVSDPQSRAKLGFLPEGTFFHDYLTGREFLDFHASLLGLPRALRRERIPRLLARVGLAGAEDRQIRRYSKGMRQRAGLAQALIGDPDLVILDEPMSGLDPL
ncbi:MAG: ABC transporter ATP-binding protein, partial [bacterium]